MWIKIAKDSRHPRWFYFILGITEIVTGLILVLSFGFLTTNITLDLVFWQMKRKQPSISNRTEENYE